MSQLMKGVKKHKIASIALSVTTALWLSGAAYFAPVVAGAVTAADLQAQITALLSQISQLQSQLSTVSGGTTSAGACGFTRSLTVGSAGSDVMCLQKYLNSSGYQVSSSGAGSPGNESTTFGPKTKAAVAKWQAAMGVSPAVGYFGSLSQAKYNGVAGGGTTGGGTSTLPPAPTGSSITVTAGTQPASSLFPWKSTRVPFTVLRFTAPTNGDVTIDSVTVERTGLANDATFAGVVLLDENGTQVGLVKTLNSLHQVILSEDFIVRSGQTRTMVVAGNAQTTQGGYGGQIAYLSVVGVSANAPVVSAFPITGAGHTVNETLSIGTISSIARGSLDPGSSQTKEVGTKNYTFSAVKLTAGSAEDIYVKYVRWYQSGSASKDDLANVIVAGDAGATYVPEVSADGKYYTTVFNDNGGKGILVLKGNSTEFSIKGDINSGSARTIDFDIQKRTDVAVTGATYGYGITPLFGAGVTADAAALRSTDDPYYDAAEVLVSSGTMTVSTNSTLSPAQNISINLSGQPLGAFTVDVRGEPITVAKLAFNLFMSDKSGDKTAADYTNVSLYDSNGKLVAGPVDGTATEGNVGGAVGATFGGEIIYTDTITFPIGVSSYVLKGKVGTDIANGDTVAASTTPSDWGTVTGQTTGKTITPSPTSALTLPTMTVKASDLTVSVSSIPIAQTVIKGASQFTFANYILDSTASGEDVRITSLPVEYNFNAGAVATDLTNCKMYDGATIINSANIKNPSAKSSSSSFVFDGSGLTLAKGTSKTLTLKCDVSGSAATSAYYNFGIDGAEDTNFTGASGLTSGRTVTETFTDGDGQFMTVAAGGTLSVVIDTNAPGYSIVNSGTTGVTLNKIRFSASNEDINLKQVALRMSGFASNTPVDLVGRKVTLWDGSTQVGEAIFPTGDNATSSVLTNFVVPRDSAKVLTIKGDIAAISNSGPLTASGDLLKVNYDAGNELTTTYNGGTYGVGVASGSNVGPTTVSDTAVTGIRIMKAYPTLVKAGLPASGSGTLQSGTQALKDLYRFSVKANGGDVALYKWTFAISSSTISATTSTYGLYVYTDGGSSSLDSTGWPTQATLDTGFTSGGLINYGSCINGLSGAQLATNVNGVPGANNSPLTVKIYPDKGTTACNATTTYIVPNDGHARYFSLKATVARTEAISGVADSISAVLSTDSAYPDVVTSDVSGNMHTSAEIDGGSNNAFIWSPVSTTSTNGVGDLDWTNGYLVIPGSFSTEYFNSAN